MTLSNGELYNHIMTNILDFSQARITHLKTLCYRKLSRITLLNHDELTQDREVSDLIAGKCKTLVRWMWYTSVYTPDREEYEQMDNIYDNDIEPIKLHRDFNNLSNSLVHPTHSPACFH